MAEKPEDLSLPASVVSRIIKDSLPDGVNVSKEARTAIGKSASVFILYATACANNFALKSKRKTLNATDVFSALEDMEFEQFVPELKECLQAYKVGQKEKREAAADRKKKQSAAAAASASTSQQSTSQEPSVPPPPPSSSSSVNPLQGVTVMVTASPTSLPRAHVPQAPTLSAVASTSLSAAASTSLSATASTSGALLKGQVTQPVAIEAMEVDPSGSNLQRTGSSSGTAPLTTPTPTPTHN